MALKLLLTGATGFIGGTTLVALLERPDVKKGDIEITCLVRGEDRAKLISEQLGVKTVVADLDDVEIVQKAAEQADIVIDTANADHPKGVGAIAAGLARRKAETGKQSIFIHSSGTGAVTDNARGEFASEKIFEDLDCADIRAIPLTYVHRGTDHVVETGAEAGDFRGYVVMPPLIYGQGTGPFSRSSVQIPAMIRGTLKLGQAPYIGKGLGMWNGVHVQDLVQLYFILMEDALSAEPKAPQGREGYYFCATDTYQWKQLATEVGKRLHAKGAIATAEPRQVTEEEEVDVFGAWSGFAYASNSRSKPGKAYQLGWKPKYHTTGLFESIDPEYDAVIEQGKDQAPKVHFDEMYNLGLKVKKPE